MRQRLAIIFTVVVVVGLLVALNAASYAPAEREAESEARPDRSTYNAGPTGARAFYDFLSETGRQVVRWREPVSGLLAGGAAKPSTFVIVGETLRPFQEEEFQGLLRWVEQGGRLVIVDRSPDQRLFAGLAGWQISAEPKHYPAGEPSTNPEELTAGVAPARPVQPTLLTREVDSVVQSRFSGVISITARAREGAAQAGTKPAAEDESDEDDEEFGDKSSSASPRGSAGSRSPASSNGGAVETVDDSSQAASSVSTAPVIHVADERGALLIDFARGSGRVILLGDPFMIANNGIGRGDNLQLAVNLVSASGGLIAFDEYHQGHSASRHPLFAYFAGTPVLAILAQGSLIILVLLYTFGRRLARPLPVAHLDRRSSLEFVSSMAELQHSARAYDLAIENVYTRTRRVLARYAGVDNKSPRAEIVDRVAARSAVDRVRLESLMRECEDVINGAPVDARRALGLVRQLREVERALGLRLRAREIRQAKEA